MENTIYKLEEKTLTATLDIAEGMNVRSLSFDGRNIITCDEERKRKGGTYAIPVLFPTPNRVSGNSYIFGGRKIEGKMHGFLRHERFHVDSVDDRRIKASYLSDGSEPTFPYKAEIRIGISLDDSGINWNFEVDNRDEHFLPGVHPYPFHSILCKEWMECKAVGKGMLVPVLYFEVPVDSRIVQAYSNPDLCLVWKGRLESI